jgi:ribosome assembly protein RRB1
VAAPRPADALRQLDLGAADEEEEDDEDEGRGLETFLPGRDRLEEGEVLEADATAYDMLHTLNVEWPCLSFDLLRDGLGDQRITVRGAARRGRGSGP